jgi:uncharacterized membrane protein YraQ (UPF0718 family)
MITVVPLLLFGIFVAYSLLSEYQPGLHIWSNFSSFLLQMLSLLPFVFILIGLFEVWVKRETVEKHLGRESGMLAYVWAVLLAGTTVGGLYVSLPVAYSLYRKGASLSVVFAYVSSSAICRVPMTLFEASLLGWRFTIVRFTVSIPLVIVTSILLGRYFESRGYQMPGTI